MDARPFDIVIYGASGFTGQFVVEELAQCVNADNLNKGDNIKWAIAGRNKQKLQKVIQDAKKNVDIDISHVPIIEANSDNYDSVLKMCKDTKLVISVIGPYRFYGEPVVKACVEAGTNYVDISGENQFLEGMQLKYHKEAKEKNICLVSASGWDSIPSDLGVGWTKKIFKGDLAGCEVVVGAKNQGNKVGFNYGTWHSAIHAIGHPEELIPIREKLFKDILPPVRSKPIHKLPSRGIVSYIEEAKGICLPFLGPDKPVVKRSQIYRYHTKNERPILCETYFRLGSKSVGGYAAAIGVITAAGLFSLMTRFSAGRSLLERYPGFFSFGMVSKDGVPRSDLKNLSSTHTIIGYGWNHKIDDLDRQHTEPPQKKIITRVSGPDPGYTATSIYLVQAGITLLKDRAQLPGFGYLTPGAAFVDTNLVERLRNRNIRFEVLKEL